MAKLNEGDIIEGIFAICLGLYVADDTIDKGKLTKLRGKIEPHNFTSGSVKIEIAKMLKKQHKNKPPDFFNVTLSIRLKPASVTGAFGEDFIRMYDTIGEIGNIDKKIDQLIKSSSTANWASKMNATKNKFLDNNIGEIVTFEIVADGIAGEASGGEIKADIEVKIYASKKSGKQQIFKEKVSFSLKSESVTVANLSPYKGMQDLAKALGLTWKNIEKYKVIGEKAMTATEKEYKFKMIKEMYNELQGLIMAQRLSISSKAYAFLEKSIFGTDMVQVVDVQRSTVKEISPEYFAELKKTTPLDVKIKGTKKDYVVFFDPKTDTPIFHLRTKLRPPPAASGAGEAKFYLEVGKGVYD
jgi:glycosyltransferase involved in cell wall biosynthesis